MKHVSRFQATAHLARNIREFAKSTPRPHLGCRCRSKEAEIVRHQRPRDRKQVSRRLLEALLAFSPPLAERNLAYSDHSEGDMILTWCCAGVLWRESVFTGSVEKVRPIAN